MNMDYDNNILPSVNRHVAWINNRSETSYDHQSFFAGPLGGRAKELYYRNRMAGIIAVAPMIFCEAMLPSARRLFWKPMRFPIADAHYAMGFTYLYQTFRDSSYYERAVHYLKALEEERCAGYKDYCWGYPFNWVTRNGTIYQETPLITSTPYVYEAFAGVHEIDRNDQWLEIMHSIAEHALNDIKEFETAPYASSCSYYPGDPRGGVINASAYRAFLLTHASVQFSDDRYWKSAERNLNFIMQCQQANGSWPYAMDNVRDFVDHFHTCFVLKAIVKIENLTGHKGCHAAVEKGVQYYVKHLFDEEGLPKPFSKPPRLTVYKSELYDYAECINLCALLQGRYPALDGILSRVVEDLLKRWQKKDGSFRSRKLYMGWDNVPMHRWAQSQIFRSLSLLLREEHNRRQTKA